MMMRFFLASVHNFYFLFLKIKKPITDSAIKITTNHRVPWFPVFCCCGVEVLLGGVLRVGVASACFTAIDVLLGGIVSR